MWNSSYPYSKIVLLEDWLLAVYSTYCRLVPFPRKTKVAICWQRGTKMRTHLRLVYYDWLFRWKWAPLQFGNKSIKCLEIVSKLLSFYGITFLLNRMVPFSQYITWTDKFGLGSYVGTWVRRVRWTPPKNSKSGFTPPKRSAHPSRVRRGCFDPPSPKIEAVGCANPYPPWKNFEPSKKNFHSGR